MRNPGNPWQLDTAVSVYRIIFICLMLSAVLFTAAFAQAQVTNIRTGIAGSGAAGQNFAPPGNGVLMKEATGSAAGGLSGGKTITLTMPAGTQADTMKVVLNGKDVSERFSPSSCNNAVCATGTLAESDGLRPQKNVLYAVAKSDGGKVVSSRLRFDGDGSSLSSFVSRSSFHAEDVSSANPALPTLSSFLPPAVALSTNLNQSGYIDGQPWITVGSQQQYPDATLKCSGQPYSVVVLQRATLQEQTPSQCFSDNHSLNIYLKSTTSTEVVIVATNNKAVVPQSDEKLDTSAIGGTDYSKVSSSDYPTNYLAIGIGQTAAGQAYENYLTSRKDPNYPPFAKGTLVEDVNGNYNFIPSDAVEFKVAPNDKTYNTAGWMLVGVPPQYVGYGNNINLLLPPETGGAGGYWLVVVDRSSLHVLPSVSPVDSSCAWDQSYNAPPHYAVYPNCGTFYQTNDSNASQATQAYLNLAAALNNLKPNQLAFLTTLGNAAYGGPLISPYWVAFTNGGDANFPQTDGDTAYYGPRNNRPGGGFFQALVNLGLPPYATMNLINGPNGTVTAFSAVAGPGLGNPLTGSSVVSTTEYAQQGQTGYIHGVLTRDRFGYFRPGRTSQEQSFATDRSNFQMALLTNQQPSDWPELSTKLSEDTDASVAGQTQAYRFASYLLISNYYLRNTQGHQDDIHYYFNGSLNTLIDYRIFDPANLDLSTAPGCSINGQQVTCSFPDPLGLPPASFTETDFNNVKKQLSEEVIDLTNVLTYLSTGSDNLKDIVAAGQANTALAMIGAAATIEGSSLSPKPSAPVQVNTGNILSMVGAVVTTVGAVVAPGAGELVGAAIGAIGDAMEAVGSASGGLTQDPTSVPNPNFAFETTLGQLANNQLLQGQMSVGFDTMADGIIADWTKLSQLGQLVGNTNNQGFYLPDQVSQNAALNIINKATQRSLMLSLLPSMYQVHYWPGVSGFNSSDIGGGNSWLPAFGYAKGTGDGNWNCDDRFYADNPPVWSSYKAFASPTIEMFSPFNNLNPNIGGFADQYIFSLPFSNKGTDSQQGKESDDPLNEQLFGAASGQLNFPFELMVMPGGAMDQPALGESSLIRMDTSSGSGFQNNQICMWPSNGTEFYPGPFGVNPGPGGSCPPNWTVNDGVCEYPDTDTLQSAPPSSLISTTTALTAPAAGVTGDDVTLSAKVTSSSGAIPTGNVLFYENEQNIGQGTLDATGTATLPTGSLPLGSYTFIARYVANQTYDTSTSNSVPVTIYQALPDMTLSLSSGSLQVSYGSTSSPVTVQVSSRYGLAGTVSFSCAGLPVGLTCTFNPAQATINAGASTTTTLTVSAQTALPSGITWFRGIGVILLVPVSLLCLWRIRTNGTQAFFCLLLLSVVSLGFLAGCGGGETHSQPLQETGSKTVLINATSGSLTRSIPIILHIQ